MGNRNRYLAGALVLAICLLAVSQTQAVERVPVGGNVYFGETPLCALVLINGQSQFSCDGNGRYDMRVPLDADGRVTVQSFADGFAPFAQAEDDALQIEIQSPAADLVVTSAETMIEVEGMASKIGGVKYIDMMFVMDTSGSLRKTDPRDYRLAGAVGLVENLSPRSDIKIGVVSFDGNRLVIETPAWAAEPGCAGIQLEFVLPGGTSNNPPPTVCNPNPIDVPRPR